MKNWFALENAKIGKKFFFVLLTISISSLVLITIISFVQILNLKKFLQNSNTEFENVVDEQSKNILLDQSRLYTREIVSDLTEIVNKTLEQIDSEINCATQFIEDFYAHPERFSGKDVFFVPNAPEGVAVSKYMFAPGVRDNADIRRELRLISNSEYIFSPLFNNNDLIDNMYLGTESGISYRYSKSNSYNASYDPRLRNWYKKAMQNHGKTIWIDTYVDSYGKLTITCARAFRDRAGNYTGVVSTDITISNVVEKVISLPIGINGYAFLLDENCFYIAHPQYNKNDFKENAMEEAKGSWLQMLRDMRNGIYGENIVEINGEEGYLFSAQIEETNWKFCVNIPIHEISSSSKTISSLIETLSYESQKYTGKMILNSFLRFVFVFVICVAMISVLSNIMSRKITEPISVLSDNVRKIGNGDFDIQIPVTSKDEIGELATVFNKMTEDIKNYMTNLAKEVSEKEYIKSELQIAANIQNDMLPLLTSDYSNNSSFMLFAKMTPAKEVGGDFYDFFWLSEEKKVIAFVIADVSGKGVPASLIMALTKALFKQNLLQGNDVDTALYLTNNALCENNPQSMFVTMFVFTIDVFTGEVTYANAGHNQPLLSVNGKPYCFMSLKNGIPLGILEGNEYVRCEMKFDAGDKILLYTDGINEAMNSDNEEWGNARFLEAANKFINLGPKEFDEAIRKAINDFVLNMEQSDDITTLSFHYTKKA
jgi:sigma-B regulation protein RsbU (phosphoserine phosphatase)